MAARHTLAGLVGLPNAEAGGWSEGVLKVAVFIEGDCVVITGLEAKPELNRCGAVVIKATGEGYGPDPESGRYGVRVELPSQRRGTCIKVKPANLRLAPHDLSARILKAIAPGGGASSSGSDAAYLSSTINSKFGKLNVTMQ